MSDPSGTPVREGPPGHHDASELDVQVVPRASQSRIVGPHDGRLKVQLAAPPVDGAANTALIDLLADDNPGPEELALANEEDRMVKRAVNAVRTEAASRIDAA